MGNTETRTKRRLKRGVKMEDKKIIFRCNLKENDINYLVQYKSGIDNHKKSFKVLVNEEEKNYLIKNNNAKVLKEVKGIRV